MLSLYTLKSAKNASQYYQQGDYYTQDGGEHHQWLGKGSEILGLRGPVDFKLFNDLLGGHLPNGELMTQLKRGGHHRPGYDLTFSAPKSVSILALVSGNELVLQAHREAVQETLAKIEKRYGGCRKKEKGVVSIERTHNLILAVFEQSDSREGDPDLHSHCVLMNLTQNSQGKWRALYADELYTDKLLNGMEYRSRLAHKLMNLGFEIEIREKGLFEIKNVPKELIGFFSKRRAQIESCLAEQGEAGGKAAAKANFLTRKKKVLLNPIERQQQWLKDLSLLGFSLETLEKIIEQAQENGPVLLPDPKEIALQAVRSAINHLAERKSVFSFHDLIKTAKLNALLPTNEGELLQAIEENIGSQGLIYLENKLLTTPEVKRLEQENLNTLKAAKDSVDKITAPWIARLVVRFNNTHPKAQKALVSLLTSNDRQVLLRSNSKALLNQTLQNYIAITQAQQFYPRVLTQNSIQIASLKKQLGLERVSTLEGFLLACEERVLKRGESKGVLEAWDRRIKKQAARDIWIVTGELSSPQLSRLGSFAEILAARIVFAQLKNSPILEPLKSQGLVEVRLKGSRRSLDSLSVQTQLLKQLSNLENTAIQEHLNLEERHQLVLEHYFKGSDKGASNKLLISLTHSERVALNASIRQRLNQEGVLKGASSLLSVLRPLGLSTEEKSQAALYQPGDVLRFNQDIPGTRLLKNSYFEVHKVDLEKGWVELHQAETQVLWDPLQYKSQLRRVEVFKKEQRELQSGDIVAWNRSFPSLGRIKGQRARVVVVNPNEVLLTLANGQKMSLNPQEFKDQHWEQGYAVQLKEASLSSGIDAIVLVHNKNLDSKNIELLSELLSTAQSDKINIRLICNNLDSLKKTIQSGSSQVQSLDGLSEISYRREEALADYQTLATQPLFNRLQGEYLKIRETNPEFLPENREAFSQSLQEPEITTQLRIACDVVDKVSLYHLERDAVLKVSELKKSVLQLGGLLAPVEILEQAIDLAIQKGWLVKVGENEQNQTLVTSKHTLLLETLYIEKMKAGQNQLSPILSQDSTALQAIQSHPRLTTGQKEAIQLILSTSDRMVAVQGIAGAGKTTALKEINRLCEANQYKTLVLANTGSAKNQAKRASQMTALTIAQFTTRMETQLIEDVEKARADYGGNQVVIVDESSLASTQDLFRVQNLIEKLNIRMVLIGDFKQLGSIGAGLSFHDLLAYGVSKAVMKENLRLSEATALLAMKQAYANDVKGTLKTLEDSVEEIPDKTEALNRMVAVYFAVIDSKKEPPLIITPLNEDRRFINQAVRQKLKEKGLLAQRGLEINVFVSTDRREIDKSNAFSYEPTDIIRFNSSHPRLGIKAGDYANILDIDLKHQRLTLSLDGKSIFYWSPKNLSKSAHIEIYKQELRELTQNELILFKRNNEAQGIFNGDTATILGIEQEMTTILLTNGKTIRLDLSQKQNQHLDYGYALTSYAAQGKDVGFVIGYGEGPKSYERKMNELKVGDRIVLPKARQAEGYEGECSKLVKIVKIEDSQLSLKDRWGYSYQVQTHEKDSWRYFPPFEQRKPSELPLSTSQQNFIVQITRGNGLFLVVPNIDDFQKTLEVHHQIKRSALSYTDPNWQRLRNGVNRLVDSIKGKVETREVLDEKQAPNLKKEPHKTRNLDHYVDKDAVNYHLESDMLGYASQWLGQPKKISGNEARWEGALTLNFRGPKAGLWKRWSTGEGGKDLISLYMAAFGVEWKVAVKEFAQSLGLSEKDTVERELTFKKAEKDTRSQEVRTKEKIDKAKCLYNEGIPITGTLAEKYLREHRGIMGELPKEFRFVKAAWHFETREFVPALLAPIKDKDEKFTGVLRVFLNRDGSKYNRTYLDEKGNTNKAIAKANLGISGHGAVTVHKGVIPTTLLVAEGIETALSVAKAEPAYTVMASLSVNQFKNVPVSPEVQRIIICADKDEGSSQTSKAVIEAIDYHLSQGRQVFLALPLGSGKRDFNDLLKEDGISLVQQSLEQMIEVKDTALLRKESLLTHTQPFVEENLSKRSLEQDSKSLDTTQSAKVNQLQRDREKELEL